MPEPWYAHEIGGHARRLVEHFWAPSLAPVKRYFNVLSVETGVELKETEGTHTKASETVPSDADYTRKSR